MTSTADVHKLLTESSAVRDGPLGRAYAAQLRRVRELLDRLREVDPEWAAEWEQRERSSARSAARR